MTPHDQRKAVKMEEKCTVSPRLVQDSLSEAEGKVKPDWDSRLCQFYHFPLFKS